MTPNQRATLIASILGSSLIFIDGTTVNVSLPIIARDLHADVHAVQWVVEGYALFLSAFLLIGGSLGDILGRKKVFGIGIFLFALASLGCGIAPNLATLIACRCLQGIAGALATPGSLSLLATAFSGGEQAKAIGTWSSFTTVTSIIGPVLGGFLTQYAAWRWIFLINLPLSIAVIAVLFYGVEESRHDARRKIDFAGGCVTALSLGALIWGLISAQSAGLTPSSGSALLFGIVGTVALIYLERTVKEPMLPMSLFRQRAFSLTNLYTLAVYAALGGSLYFVPFELIDVHHYSASFAGSAMLPTIGMIFIFSRWSGGLVPKYGTGPLLAVGATVCAAGFATYAAVAEGRNYWTSFFPASILLGLGLAALVSPLTSAVMGSVDQQSVGVASAFNNAVSRTAGLVAIAAFGLTLHDVHGGHTATIIAHAFAPAMVLASGLALVGLPIALLPPLRTTGREVAG